MSKNEIRIAGKKIGAGYPVYIIAEIGINHDGNMDQAKEMILAARDTGADAVKFQSFTAEGMVSRKLMPELFDLYKSVELSENDHLVLKEYAEGVGITFLSSVFDTDRLDFLKSINLPAYKIASSELTNEPLLKAVAGTGKPIILSSGQGTTEEIEIAVRLISENGNDDLALLQCTSLYPTAPEDVNLRTIRTMAEKFGLPVGFSDHTTGYDIAIASVAAGAVIIEKHFTTDNNLPGPDHKLSLDKKDFALMVTSIRRISAALGSAEKAPVQSELKERELGRKGLYAKADISAGTEITAQMIVPLKPPLGLSPAELPNIIGRKVKTDLKAGDPIKKEHISD
jgi:N,N'-diacetyllegionaminate synthase